MDYAGVPVKAHFRTRKYVLYINNACVTCEIPALSDKTTCFVYQMLLLLLTVLNARANAPSGDWTVFEVEGGFLVKCGDQILHSVHSGKPRLFKSMDTVVRKLREELGIVEFKVVAMKPIAAAEEIAA